MKILVSQDEALLALLEEGPLRREGLELAPLPARGDGLDAELIQGTDLILASAEGGPGLDRLRREGVEVNTVSSRAEAARIFESVGLVSRRDDRLPLRLPVRVEGPSGGGEGRTKDLSRSGAFVHCEPVGKAGQAVTLRFIGEAAAPVVRARIVRVEPGGDYRLAGLALRFEDSETASRDGLQALLGRSPSPLRQPSLYYPPAG